jgi:hypothetical protein
VVRVVELDVEPCYHSGQLTPAVRVEGPTGRQSRVRVDRIERWEVVASDDALDDDREPSTLEPR